MGISYSLMAGYPHPVSATLSKFLDRNAVYNMHHIDRKRVYIEVGTEDFRFNKDVPAHRNIAIATSLENKGVCNHADNLTQKTFKVRKKKLSFLFLNATYRHIV